MGTANGLLLLSLNDFLGIILCGRPSLVHCLPCLCNGLALLWGELYLPQLWFAVLCCAIGVARTSYADSYPAVPRFLCGRFEGLEWSSSFCQLATLLYSSLALEPYCLTEGWVGSTPEFLEGMLYKTTVIIYGKVLIHYSIV